MGFGLGSLTLGTLANTIINSAGLVTALVVVATTAGIVMTLLALLLKQAPNNIGKLLGVDKKAQVASDEEADGRKLFRDPAFYGYYLWATILLGAGVLVIGTSKLGALELGIDEALATTLVGIIPIVNGAAGLSMGIIYDRMGLRFSMILAAAISFVSCTMIACSFWFDIDAFYIAGCLILVTSYGSVAPLATAFARERYGAERFARNLPIVNTDIAGGSAFQQVIVSASSGSSPVAYTAMAVSGAVALLISLAFGRFTKSRK